MKQAVRPMVVEGEGENLIIRIDNEEWKWADMFNSKALEGGIDEVQRLVIDEAKINSMLSRLQKYYAQQLTKLSVKGNQVVEIFEMIIKDNKTIEEIKNWYKNKRDEEIYESANILAETYKRAAEEKERGDMKNRMEERKERQMMKLLQFLELTKEERRDESDEVRKWLENYRAKNNIECISKLSG